MLVYTVVVNVFHVMLMHYMSPSYLIVSGICSDLHVVVVFVHVILQIIQEAK